MATHLVDTVGNAEIASRLGMALLSGLIIGFERESHGRAAGLRTTMLVGSAAATAMILSQMLFIGSISDPVTGWRPDPARLAAGILTGMGFLGAGAIIRQDNVVRGVTTAAVLWFVTVLGLAYGSGNFLVGNIGLGVAMVTLFVIPTFEGWIKNDWYATVSIVTKLEGFTDDQIRDQIQACGLKVKRVELSYDLKTKEKSFSCEVKFKKADLFDLSERVIKKMTENPSVVQVKWS
jgi:putative Mg2+ transporter-C (MgtC) family protein